MRAEVFQPKSGWNPDKSTSDHKPVLRSQPGGCGRLCRTAGEYLWRLKKRNKESAQVLPTRIRDSHTNPRSFPSRSQAPF